MTASASPEPLRERGSDPLPLLPSGTPVFVAIPLRAVVLEELPAVVGDGTLVVHEGSRGAVILVRGGQAREVHVVEDGAVRSGPGLLAAVQAWGGATVSADKLDRPLVDLCATLLGGETLYDDLRLMWVSWPALLADLGRRGGTYVVEIATPVGRGVTCVAAGRQALSYTDIHPSLGDPALLEAMASNQEGSVRVLHVGEAGLRDVRAAARRAAPETRPSAPTAAGSAPAQEPAGAAAAAAGSSPDAAWVAPWETRWRAGEAAPAAGGNGGAHQPEAAPESRPATWREFASTALAAEPRTVADVLDELRTIAQRRLQLSASRVEAVLDEAALEGRSLESVLEEIRAMSIRGVMPSTVEAMTDEMAAAVGRGSD